MGEQNFSWKVVAAASCCSVHFDNEKKKKKLTQIQLLQPRRMEVHEDGICITATPWDCSRLFNLACLGADVFAVLPELGSQITTGIDSPVIKE